MELWITDKVDHFVSLCYVEIMLLLTSVVGIRLQN